MTSGDRGFAAPGKSHFEFGFDRAMMRHGGLLSLFDQGGPALAAEVAPSAAWGACIFGAALVIAAVSLMRWHVRSWAAHRANAAAGERALLRLRRQYRRRMQVAALLALTGVLIPVGVAVIDWQGRPGWWAAYWIVVLLLACWMLLLAAGDLLALRMGSQAELGRLRRQQEELERQIAEMRSRKHNGRRQQ